MTLLWTTYARRLSRCPGKVATGGAPTPERQNTPGRRAAGGAVWSISGGQSVPARSRENSVAAGCQAPATDAAAAGSSARSIAWAAVRSGTDHAQHDRGLLALSGGQGVVADQRGERVDPLVCRWQGGVPRSGSSPIKARSGTSRTGGPS